MRPTLLLAFHIGCIYATIVPIGCPRHSFHALRWTLIEDVLISRLLIGPCFTLKDAMSSANTPLKVMLVEDHTAFREALAFKLSGEPDIEVVAQAGSLAEAREVPEGGLEGCLDVAVVDLGLPDGDGSVLIGELRKSHPGASVVVLSAAMGPRYLDEAVKAGSDVVLDKVESIPTIAEEVRRLGGNEPHPSARSRP